MRLERHAAAVRYLAGEVPRPTTAFVEVVDNDGADDRNRIRLAAKATLATRSSSRARGQASSPLRVGEGLERGTFSITKSRDEHAEAAPKTEKSRREIPLLPRSGLTKWSQGESNSRG